MMSARRPPTWLLILPLLLLPIMAGVFVLCTRWWGAEAGYLAGFGFYWLFWCLFIPRALLEKVEFAADFVGALDVGAITTPQPTVTPSGDTPAA
jgi:hypothetical protein